MSDSDWQEAGCSTFDMKPRPQSRLCLCLTVIDRRLAAEHLYKTPPPVQTQSMSDSD